MDNIIEVLRSHQAKENEHMGVVSVRLAYEKTDSSSPLRRYLTDSLAYTFMKYKKDTNLWPTSEISDLMDVRKDFRDDFLARLRTIPFSPPGALPDPRYAPICEYHHHGKEEVCPVKKSS